MYAHLDKRFSPVQFPSLPSAFLFLIQNIIYLLSNLSKQIIVDNFTT